MGLNKILAARQSNGRLISASDLTISSLGTWSCAPSGNPYHRKGQSLDKADAISM